MNTPSSTKVPSKTVFIIVTRTTNGEIGNEFDNTSLHFTPDRGREGMFNETNNVSYRTLTGHTNVFMLNGGLLCSEELVPQAYDVWHLFHQSPLHEPTYDQGKRFSDCLEGICRLFNTVYKSTPTEHVCLLVHTGGLSILELPQHQKNCETFVQKAMAGSTISCSIRLMSSQANAQHPSIVASSLVFKAADAQTLFQNLQTWFSESVKHDTSDANSQLERWSREEDEFWENYTPDETGLLKQINLLVKKWGWRNSEVDLRTSGGNVPFEPPITILVEYGTLQQNGQYIFVNKHFHESLKIYLEKLLKNKGIVLTRVTKQNADLRIAYMPIRTLLRLPQMDAPPIKLASNIGDPNYTEKPNLPTLCLGFLPLNTSAHNNDNAVLPLDETDTRYRFFDSSVWFRYLPLTKLDQQASMVLKEVSDYKQSAVYRMTNAHESLDFYSRLFNESYIKSPAGNPNGGHGGKVAPWSFHSEWVMRDRVEQLRPKLDNIKWRMLLVDDHSTRNLHVLHTNPGRQPPTEGDYTKANLIKNLLVDWGQFNVHICRKASDESYLNPTQTKPDIVIHTASSIREAQTLLTSDAGLWYDIVLLDYLLVDGERKHYGNELISLLFPVTKNPSAESKGALGKYWFFPVSVYGNTLSDKLHDEGYAFYRNDFVFAAGADPLTTPWLFLQSLMDMMLVQLREVLDFRGDHLQSALLRTFTETGNNQTIDKKWALQSFPNIVMQGARFKQLCRHLKTNDRDAPKSLFASSVVAKHFFNLQFYDWEHIQNLVYLLAHGTSHQRGQMWEEYKYLERHLKLHGHLESWKNVLKTLSTSIYDI